MNRPSSILLEPTSTSARASESFPGFSRLSVRLVRDPEVGLSELPDITRPAETIRFLWDRIFSNLDREAVCALYLSSTSRVIGWSLIHIGAIDRCPFDSRLVILPAILSSATQVIVAHNHPSGIPTPSLEDSIQSFKLAAACNLLDLRLVDSFILVEPIVPGDSPRWTRIDWPGKGVVPRCAVRYAVEAGILDPIGTGIRA